MTTYNNVLGVFSYAAHTLANTLWSERALSLINLYMYSTFKMVKLFSSETQQRIGYNLNVMQHTACLEFNQVLVKRFDVTRKVRTFKIMLAVSVKTQ